jgi:hypothetical protein
MPTPQENTLLDLIQSIISEAKNDEEVVATVVYLINSGRVRLCGSFAGAKIIFPRKVIPRTDAPLNPSFVKQSHRSHP